MTNPFDIIDEIEQVRKTNNTSWMDILRLAFKHAPKEASRIMKEIAENDSKINVLSKKL